MLPFPGDLQAEGKQGFGVSFLLSIRRMFIMQPESFRHFRIKKWVPQLDRIRFTFLWFPISFLSAAPPQSRLNSFLFHSQPALHRFLLPVCIFLSSSSFTPKLPLQPQLSFCPASPSPISHVLHAVPSSAAAGPRGAGKCPPLPWEEVLGLGGLVGPGGICSGDSCTPACRCRGSQHHESALPLHLEDFVGNSGRN